MHRQGTQDCLRQISLIGLSLPFQFPKWDLIQTRTTTLQTNEIHFAAKNESKGWNRNKMDKSTDGLNEIEILKIEGRPSYQYFRSLQTTKLVSYNSIVLLSKFALYSLHQTYFLRILFYIPKTLEQKSFAEGPGEIRTPDLLFTRQAL